MKEGRGEQNIIRVNRDEGRREGKVCMKLFFCKMLKVFALKNPVFSRVKGVCFATGMREGN
jgi:hypothetical protein